MIPSQGIHVGIKKEKLSYTPSFKNKDYKEGTINMHTSCHEQKMTPMSEERLAENIIGTVLIQQYKLMTGLKMFGDKGEKELPKELTQLQDKETFIPIDS